MATDLIVLNGLVNMMVSNLSIPNAIKNICINMFGCNTVGGFSNEDAPRSAISAFPAIIIVAATNNLYKYKRLLEVFLRPSASV